MAKLSVSFQPSNEECLTANTDVTESGNSRRAVVAQPVLGAPRCPAAAASPASANRRSLSLAAAEPGPGCLSSSAHPPTPTAAPSSCPVAGRSLSSTWQRQLAAPQPHRLSLFTTITIPRTRFGDRVGHSIWNSPPPQTRPFCYHQTLF